MVDALMVLWNRYHKKHGARLLLTLLLLGVSVSLLSFTIDVSSHASFPNARRTTTTVGRGQTAAVVFTSEGAPGSEGWHVARRCTIVPSVEPLRRASVVSGGDEYRARQVAVTPTTYASPSPTPSPTATAEPIAPTATEEVTPTPDPSEEGTPVADPTGVALPPSEKMGSAP